METKICTLCKKELPATNEYFHINKRGKYGLMPRCKECRKQEIRNYYLNNKEEVKKKCKIYREENKEFINEKKREKFRSNPSLGKEQYQKNKEYQKEYNEKNKYKLKELAKEYRIKNKEKIKQKDKEYYQKVKSKRQKRDKEYYKNNKEMYFESAKIRKQIKRANGGTYTKKQWQECLEFFNYKCAYTGEELKNDMHIDHIIPISKGGKSFIWNLCPSVESANISKYNKDLEEWYKEQDYYSEERLKRIYDWIEKSKNKYL